MKISNGTRSQSSTTGSPTIPSRPIIPSSTALPLVARDNRRVATLVKVDVLYGFIGLDQHLPKHEAHGFKVSAEGCEVVWLQAKEDAVAKGRKLVDMALSRLGKSARISQSSVPEARLTMEPL